MIYQIFIYGISSNSSSSFVIFSDSPIISCDSTAAFVGEKNVYLSCFVRARPRPISVYWMLDEDGMIVTEGDVIEEYWIINSNLVSPLHGYTSGYKMGRPLNLVEDAQCYK